jgi:chorismate dehydratase
MALHVGEITYTNILPLYYYIDRKKLIRNDITFIPQVPSRLNQAMKDGKIDVGAISSFAYGENFHEYDLLPNLSVSSNGKVNSIFLFSKTPIEDLENKSIALTSSSATSVHLLKILLREYYSYEHISYETMEPHLDSMLKQHDACLLIGDDAIEAIWKKENEGLFCYDLGELWTKFTNLPMTFAVVAVRKSVLSKEANLVALLLDEMNQSKTLSIQNGFLPMIEEIKENHPGSYHFWEEYFTKLEYHFQDRQFRGLKLYFDLCYKHGFIKEVPKLSFVNDYALTHSI